MRRPGYWLAERGHRVLVVEKKRFPARRRAATASRRGPSASSTTWASPSRSRSSSASTACGRSRHGVTLELALARAPRLPAYGYVVRRRDLDEMVADRAVKAGRDALAGAEAVAPLVEDGLVTGATVAPQGHRRDRGGPGPLRGGGRRRQLPLRPGARHRPRPHVPLGMAIRGYFTSPFHDEPWIESHLDLRDRDGNHLPGLRLDLPGRRRHRERRRRPARRRSPGWKDVNTSQLMDAFVRDRARALGHLARDVVRRRRPAASCPTGGSVTPNVGPTWLVVGDAAGSVNPFNGEGISLAYETGRLAADAVDLALADRRRARARSATREQLEEVYGLYFKVARTFVRAIGNPAVMRELTRVGMQSPHAHGVGAADHGQPAAPRRARPGRGRVQASVAAPRCAVAPEPLSSDRDARVDP